MVIENNEELLIIWSAMNLTFVIHLPQNNVIVVFFDLEKAYGRPMTWKYGILHDLNKSSAVAGMGDRGHNRHGPKRGGGAVPLSRSAGNPSNMMWPAPRSNSVPNAAFIHRAVWPQ